MNKREIFSKDYITIEELGHLLGLSYQMSARKMRDIKKKYDSLKVRGKLAVSDYKKFLKEQKNDKRN